MKGKLAAWKQKVAQYLAELVGDISETRAYAEANRELTHFVVAGRGPDDKEHAAPMPGTGARMVVNISSAHVPAFCQASRSGGAPKAYKNWYDFKKDALRLGDPTPDTELRTRELVDQALPLRPGVTPDKVYFGAVEINGTGVRFYGDVCMVLSTNAVQVGTVVLDRNSYDLVRRPIRDRVERVKPAKQMSERRKEAAKLAGIWPQDLGRMAFQKALFSLGVSTRRWTTGQISEAVRDDEDYMEVLKEESFGTSDLQEARFSAANAALDALIGDRMNSGPLPRIEMLIWRHRRSCAELELRRNNVPVRVVTTAGRTKD